MNVSHGPGQTKPTKSKAAEGPESLEAPEEPEGPENNGPVAGGPTPPSSNGATGPVDEGSRPTGISPDLRETTEDGPLVTVESFVTEPATGQFGPAAQDTAAADALLTDTPHKAVLRMSRMVPLLPTLEVPAQLHKFILDKRLVTRKQFSWQSRVLQRFAYAICTHVSNHNTKSYDWYQVLEKYDVHIEDVALKRIIDVLDKHGLLDWGKRDNILPMTTGLAFMDIVPETAKPSDDVLNSIKIPNITFTPEHNKNLTVNIEEVLMDHTRFCRESLKAINAINMPIEQLAIINWFSPSINSAIWDRFYRLLVQFLNENPLPPALNKVLGPRVQVAFDLTCLLAGSQTEAEAEAEVEAEVEAVVEAEGVSTEKKKKRKSLSFFEKRMNVAEVFATNYAKDESNPGRWSITGTNYLTFRADFRQTILRAANLEGFLPRYQLTSVDITGCHLGVALALLGPAQAPILWNIFENGLNQWDEARRHFPPGVPYYKRDLKAAFYALLNGGSSNYEGITRHIKKCHQAQKITVSEAELMQIVNNANRQCGA